MCSLRRGGAFSFPQTAAHTGGADQLDDPVVGHLLGAVENGHPAVHHIKGQMFGAANRRAEHLVQDRHLFGTIQPVDAKTAAIRVYIAYRPDIAAHCVAAGPAACTTLTVIVTMCVFVVVV